MLTIEPLSARLCAPNALSKVIYTLPMMTIKEDKGKSYSLVSPVS